MTKPHKGTALLTGASSGIGAIYAEHLARRGYDLVLVARNRDRLVTLAERITTKTRRVVEVLDGDLCDAAHLAVVEAKLREDASITLLVNNASIGTQTPVLQGDIERMTKMIALNVTAPTRLTNAVVPGFVARNKGSVINILSVADVGPKFLSGAYGRSMDCMLEFSLSLHHQVVSKGVRIQAVFPGAVVANFRATDSRQADDLPAQIAMRAEYFVDAALAGFDRGELITIPSLHAVREWDAYAAARQPMAAPLCGDEVATRDRITH